MITITDGIRNIELDEKQLKVLDGNYLIQSKYDFWQTDLAIIYEKGIIKKIVKEMPNGGDTLEEYKNISKNDSIILLKNTDYDSVISLIDKMKLDDSYRKNAIIDSVSTFFANDCYEYYVLADIYTIDIETNFNDLMPPNFDDYYRSGETTKYKEEIFEMTKKKLKDIYKVDLDYLFGGENNE